jgi:hypothetical protein
MIFLGRHLSNIVAAAGRWESPSSAPARLSISTIDARALPEFRSENRRNASEQSRRTAAARRPGTAAPGDAPPPFSTST